MPKFDLKIIVEDVKQKLEENKITKLSQEVKVYIRTAMKMERACRDCAGV